MITPTHTTLGQRIVIVGSSCAGKTTLAQQIAAQYALPHIELDALHWDADWTAPSTEEFRARVSAALADHAAWVTDGNYSKARDLIWAQADTLIWLDFPLWRVIVPRILRRTFQRVVGRQTLWNGNRETWRAVFSRDSLLLYTLRTYHRRRQTYHTEFAQYPHLNVIHLQSPRALRAWWAHITGPDV